MRKLKVYGWQGYRSECHPRPNGSRQTREICAATSQAKVAELAGVKRPYQLFNLCETGNAKELATALREPFQIFWHPLDDYAEQRFIKASATPPSPDV